VEGVVDYVYDPTEPSPPKGNNDMGFSVRVGEPPRMWYWFGLGRHPELDLVSRGAPPEPNEQ
jgi:hypothetical protein